jgi:sugar O-acyltransferase (sialic acid O-acetyltransferase NeuD family)
MKRKILIGFDPDLLDLVLANKFSGYIAREKHELAVGLDYLGNDDYFNNNLNPGTLFAFGFDMPKYRKELVENYSIRGKTIVSKSATIGKIVMMGSGCTIGEFAYIGAGARIENFVKVGVRSSLHHESFVGAYTVLAPSTTVCGKVKIGTGVFIGANAVILSNLIIDDYAIIGAGSVVTKNVKAGKTVAGNPAIEF